MKHSISKFDELVIAALGDDVLAAIEKIDLEERVEHVSKNNFITLSQDRRRVILLMKLSIPTKTLLWVIVTLVGLGATFLKLDPALAKGIQDFVKGF